MLKLTFIQIIFLFLFLLPISKQNNEFVFPKDIDYESYKNICKENIYIEHEKCFSYSKKYENELSNILSKINMSSVNETDKEKISFIYYNLGNIYYHGFTSKEPDLDTGLAYFIISSFFGSPQSKYKLSIILSNDIFEQIYQDKKFKNLLLNFDMLNKISKTDFYIKNFEYLINEYNSI